MNIVVAVYDDWGIGRDGGQPVVVKADRRHFKEVTGSGTVILGRRTLEDFPGGRPLKGRRNIILTRDKSFSVDSGEVVHSVSEAIRAAERAYTDRCSLTAIRLLLQGYLKIRCPTYSSQI